MKRYFAFLLAILTCASSVRGSLGESDDRIEDSYGKLVERHLLDDGKVTVGYHKDRYLYFVIFENHRSILERYSRTDGRGLSSKEISKFLKANGGDPAWKEVEQSTPHLNPLLDRGGEAKDKKEISRRWERNDHKAEATYGDLDGRPTLTVKFKER